MKLQQGRKIYTPSEVNYFAKETLEQLNAWIEAEVSEFKKHPSFSFYYLTLKDSKSILPCIASGSVIEKTKESLLGKKVYAYGNLTLYEPYAKYQMRLYQLELAGEGDINKHLEELILKLRSEGLFDATHKKVLPKYPKRVCLISSHGSDAWNDFLTHSTLKFPIIEVVAVDSRVQGSGSVESIISALKSTDNKGFDIVVITRGGGSTEDLTTFNDEQVARAIFEMKTPTLVAIGHEANESLAEWVADVRASTPTDAANIVTASWQNVLERINSYGDFLINRKEKLIDFNLERLDYIYSSLTSTKTFLESYEEKLKSIQKSLKILSPQDTLSRGYAIVTDESNKIITTTAAIVVGDSIGVKFSSGSIKSKVTSKS